MMCKRASSPLAQKVSDLADKGLWIELQQLEVDPSGYTDAFSYWADAMCVDLVRKAVLPTGVDTAQAAVDTFLETERDCYRVNRRIRTLFRESVRDISPSDMATIELLGSWQRKIRDVMGKVPESLQPRFSTGATTTTTRLTSTIFDKLSTTPQRYAHSTLEVDHVFYGTLWGQVAHDRRLYPTVTRANEYFTVPKSGLTDRSCCKEAVLNVSIQLAVGAVFRRRLLKKMAIDLDYGATTHRIKAREGSIFDDIATLDMSSASDRWARELVRYLLPWDWEVLLNSLRATHTRFGDKTLYLEKFSSMGNGFTFELETILFATLAECVKEREGITGEILCFGDDLIVPAGLANSLLSWLRAFGHKPNLRKSFVEGPFRESCGGDFFKGEAVSTVKLPKLPEEPQDWIKFANNLRRVAGGRERYWGFVRPVWRLALAQLPNQIRKCVGPTFLGDVVIHDHEPEGGWPERVLTYAPVSLSVRTPFEDWTHARLAVSLISEPLGRELSLPKVTGYRFKWLPGRSLSDWLPGDRGVPVPEDVRIARKLAREPYPYWLPLS